MKKTAARAAAATKTGARSRRVSSGGHAKSPAANAAASAPRAARRKGEARTLPTPAALLRERRRLPETEDDFVLTGDARQLSSARAGGDELRAELLKHTEGGPGLTAGDIDARWQDAYAQGDESPGGDNPTPDQDRVDDIGRALGVQYDDDEELLGGEEIAERDQHRWEWDPASREEDENE